MMIIAVRKYTEQADPLEVSNEQQNKSERSSIEHDTPLKKSAMGSFR